VCATVHDPWHIRTYFTEIQFVSIIIQEKEKERKKNSLSNACLDIVVFGVRIVSSFG